MRVKDTPINEIEQDDNSRIREIKHDIVTLMQSIKHEGLLQPIGVIQTETNKYKIVYGNRRLEACKKLGWHTIPAVIMQEYETTDFYIKNLIENIERENITEAELGRIIMKLKEQHKLTNSEISARLNIPERRVINSLNIMQHVPEKYKELIVHGRLGSKKGKIPSSTAETALALIKRRRLNKKQTEQLLDYARKDGVTHSHMVSLAKLAEEGYTIEEAQEMLSNYKIQTIRLTITNKEITRLLTKHKKPLSTIVKEILAGKLDEKIDVKRLTT